VGFIPDGFIGIFHSLNSSGCTMALGSTLPLSARDISWGGGRGKGGYGLGLTIIPQ
jgi:hypothetical protein